MCNLQDKPDNVAGYIPDSSWLKKGRLLALAILITSFIIYILTAYRTITWWDNAEYSLAAITLGIPHPPGSLLTVLLGWIVTKIPLGLTNIFKLNLLAGLAASMAAVIIYAAAVKVYKAAVGYEYSGRQSDTSFPFLIGAAIAGLTFSFTITTWSYAVKLTPYIFTACLTAIIIWAFLRWWNEADSESANRWLFIITLLFGLDFSIHRTNMLLLPALFFWILIRRGQSFGSLKFWLAGIGGLAIGLSFHLITILISANNSIYNMADPSNLARFWDYISLKQYGGGWLINIFPRKAPFWSVQIKDYADVFAGNFFSIRGKLGVLGICPAIFGVYGLIIMWLNNRKLAIAVLIVFIFSSLGAMLYFNLPPDYFRTIDRHYLPSFVVFAFLIAFGLGCAFDAIGNLTKNRRWIIPVTTATALLILPCYQLAANYKQVDGSNDYFTCDFGSNLLKTLPGDAILFTNGDVDTFTPWYLQKAERQRPDVSVINIPLLNTPWFVAQSMAADSGLPLRLSPEEIANLDVKPWQDTAISIATKCDRQMYDIPDSLILPDSITFRISPTIANKYLLAQDWIMLQIIINNAWKRPIYFAFTVSPENSRWVEPYLRPEGFASRLMPMQSPPMSEDIIYRNLLENYSFRGYADPRQRIDEFPRRFASNYYNLFIQLASAKAAKGDFVTCEKIRKYMLEILPPNRLEPLPVPLKQYLDLGCKDFHRE